MANDVPPPVAAPPLWLRPWVLAGVALGLSLLGLLLSGYDLGGADWVRLAVLMLSLLVAGAAVQRRLSAGMLDLDDRLEAAGLVFACALAALLDALSFGDAWDSGRMLAGVLAGVGVLAAFLVALAPPFRKAIASLLILFHFGGILAAVTAIEPVGQQPPYLSIMAWAHVYRPYLGFLYLNNAYHFYSPEPGPATLLWYRVEYASGKTRFFKIPERGNDPMPIHYQRYLALTDSINQTRPIDERTWDEIQMRRQRDGLEFHIPRIPNPPLGEYGEPADFPRRLTATYARHIVRTSVNPDDPSDPAVRVRMYRVVHKLLEATDVAAGVDPQAPWMYSVFYLGEFDSEGWLTSPTRLTLRDEQGTILVGYVREETTDTLTILVGKETRTIELRDIAARTDLDHFIYWNIPIARDRPDSNTVQNYLETHALVPTLKIDNSEVMP